MHTFFLLLWGTCTLASIIGAIIVVVLHDRHLRQDMELRDEGIYITRVPRREALISLLTPILPAGFFAFYLYTQAELGILFNLLIFIRLLAIVRFRLGFDRWPDMRDPQDLAYVDTWDSLEWTRPLFRKLYRRRNKITGLADIKM